MNIYLDTAISLVLIILVFSVVVYVLQELIAINLKYRGKMLWYSIAQLLDKYTPETGINLNKAIPVSRNTTLTDTFFNHPQIQSLKMDSSKLPSYIAASNFSLAILDAIAGQTGLSTNLFNDFKTGLAKYSATNSEVYTVLKNITDNSSDLKDLKTQIESWFNNYMDRVTGWYQSHTVVTIRLLALGVTLFFNLNMINLTQEIAGNSQLRSQLVGISQNLVDHPDKINSINNKAYDNKIKEIDSRNQSSLDAAKTPAARLVIQEGMDKEKKSITDEFSKKELMATDSLLKQLNATHLPIGWKKNFMENFKGNESESTLKKIFLMILGWAIAAGCISMGAPFWFNLLIKLVNLRRAGIKPESKDIKK